MIRQNIFFTIICYNKVLTAVAAAFVITACILIAPVISPAQETSDKVSLVEVTAQVSPETVSPGAKAILKLKLKMPVGMHANSDLSVDPDQIPTIFFPKAQTGIFWEEPQYPKPSRIVEWYADEPLMVFQNGAIITVPLTIDKTVSPGQLTLEGNLHIQVCDHEKCYPPRRIPIRSVIEIANDNISSNAKQSEGSDSKKSGL